MWMAEFFCCYPDDNGGLAVEEEGKGFTFGNGSDDGFNDAAFLAYGSLVRFVLVSGDVVAEVEMPRGSTAGTWNGQIRAVRMDFDNHVRFAM